MSPLAAPVTVPPTVGRGLYCVAMSYEIHMIIGECTKTATVDGVQAVADKLSAWSVPFDADALRSELDRTDAWATEISEGTPRLVTVRAHTRQ